MTTLLSDLDLEVGPDHYFHVVPAVSESSLSLLRVVTYIDMGAAGRMSLGLSLPLHRYPTH